VGDDRGFILGGELGIPAGMIAVEMGVDDVFDRLAAGHLVHGRFDLLVQRRELSIHLDDRVIANGNDDVPALAFQHIGAIAEVGGLDLNLREILPLRKGCCREQGGCGCDCESKPHWNPPP